MEKRFPGPANRRAYDQQIIVERKSIAEKTVKHSGAIAAAEDRIE
jgi:hypothetical protein